MSSPTPLFAPVRFSLLDSNGDGTWTYAEAADQTDVPDLQLGIPVVSFCLFTKAPRRVPRQKTFALLSPQHLHRSHAHTLHQVRHSTYTAHIHHSTYTTAPTPPTYTIAPTRLHRTTYTRKPTPPLLYFGLFLSVGCLWWGSRHAPLSRIVRRNALAVARANFLARRRTLCADRAGRSALAAAPCRFFYVAHEPSSCFRRVRAPARGAS